MGQVQSERRKADCIFATLTSFSDPCWELEHLKTQVICYCFILKLNTVSEHSIQSFRREEESKISSFSCSINEIFLLVLKVKVVTQSCPTLCDSMDYNLSCGFLQVRVLEWVAISFSRGSSWPRDWTQVSCIAGRFFTNWATRKANSEIWESDYNDYRAMSLA